MLKQKTIKKLQAIVKAYKDNIKLPKPGKWKTMSDSEIWLAIVGQVGVVGSSAPVEKMTKKLHDRKYLYESLVSLKPAQRRKELHRMLSSYGIRYVSKNADECRKTNALVKNMALVESYGGPKKYLERVSRAADEHMRIATVIQDMAYIKNKGARDFLIGVGLIEDAIAFDVRITNVLVACGASLPDDVGSNKFAYLDLEAKLIEKVCKPCGVSGAVLDRVLYQKYSEIV